MIKKPTKKKKAKKLPSLFRLRRLADRLWSLKVKAVYGSKCAVCGASEVLNSHHIEPRTSSAVIRWDVLDGISLCVTHHKYGRDAAHKSAIFFYEFVKSKVPNVIEYIKPLRPIELKAGKVSREQMAIVLSSLWADITQEQSNVWNLGTREALNNQWLQAREAMALTVWEKEYLQSLPAVQGPTWPPL